MKSSFYILCICFVGLFISSCSNYNEALLHGQWAVANWEVLSTGQTINSKMDFDFKPDGTYLIDYGSATEAGKYWITADFLHTIEEGQTEKSVRVMKLNADSLLFQMNRAGSLENVLLTKVK